MNNRDFSLNPIGAIMNVHYGALLHPGAWEIITGIVEEAFHIAGAEGVRLPWNAHDKYLEYLKSVQMPATAGYHSSMLQDISRGRRTEIDFLNGAVVRLGASHHIPTPSNTCINRLVQFRETFAKERRS
jgi:2-dehydropantoate 2-reductase